MVAILNQNFSITSAWLHQRMVHLRMGLYCDVPHASIQKNWLDVKGSHKFDLSAKCQRPLECVVLALRNSVICHTGPSMTIVIPSYCTETTSLLLLQVWWAMRTSLWLLRKNCNLDCGRPGRFGQNMGSLAVMTTSQRKLPQKQVLYWIATTTVNGSMMSKLRCRNVSAALPHIRMPRCH